MGVKAEYQDSKFKRYLERIARLFGFYYPSQVIEAYDRDNKRHIIEDPIIEDQDTKQLPVLKKKDVPDNPKELPEALEKSENPEDLEKKEVKQTLIRDPDSKKTITVIGNAKEYFDLYPKTEIFASAMTVLVVPFGIFYTWILMWAFGVVDMSDLALVLNTVLISTMIYQGYNVLTPSLSVLKCSYKGQVEGLEMYVPMDRRFLNIEPSEDKDLKSSIIERLIPYIRPLIAENSYLESELNNNIDKMNKAYYQGQRDRVKEENIFKNPYLIAIIVFIAGLILGMLLSGGIQPAPSPTPPSNPGTSPTNETAKIITAIAGRILP